MSDTAYKRKTEQFEHLAKQLRSTTQTFGEAFECLDSSTQLLIQTVFNAGWSAGHQDAHDWIASGEYSELVFEPIPAPIPSEWRTYHSGKKIDAIKAYRARTCRSLTESVVAFGHAPSLHATT